MKSAESEVSVTSVPGLFLLGSIGHGVTDTLVMRDLDHVEAQLKERSQRPSSAFSCPEKVIDIVGSLS